MVAAIVGFFATAGAAGVDICTSNRNKQDVSMGGIVGIVMRYHFHGRHLGDRGRWRSRLGHHWAGGDHDDSSARQEAKSRHVRRGA
jgi:hypothetical protein